MALRGAADDERRVAHMINGKYFTRLVYGADTSLRIIIYLGFAQKKLSPVPFSLSFVPARATSVLLFGFSFIFSIRYLADFAPLNHWIIVSIHQF